MKALTIVVASKNTRRTIERCLDALTAQVQGENVEILLIDASTDNSAEIARRFGLVKVIQADQASLVPELWGKGIELSEGQAVAFTTANFIPANNWVKEALALLQTDHAAIGGVFEKRKPDALSQWAIYFLRYSPYMPTGSPRSAPQIAADNAVYKRWVFEKYEALLANGFWEHEVNRRLKAEGHSLFLTPSLKVSMGYFSAPIDFFQQRFHHGRAFGAERAANVSVSKRIFYILASPLIPFALSARVVRNVMKNSKEKTYFVLSLPWFLFYTLGWSAGELVGYLTGRSKENRANLTDSASASHR